MKCIAWNYRGLGNPRTIRAFRELIRKEDPHVIFLSETKLHANKLDRLKLLCRMNKCFGVDIKGRSEGLVFFMER